MFNNNSSKGQTTIELLLILTVSVVILAIIYSIYADQFTGNVSSTELFLARSSVQKIVNASNTAYLSGIGSIIKVEVDFPSSVDFDNSKLSSNIISLKLLGGLDVVGIADINFGGSLRKQYGKQVIYLVFDGNKVNLDYLDFELNQYNISFSTLADTNRKETISVRNNSSSNMSFVIENNFSSPGVNIILSKTEFVLAPNAIEYIDFNFIIAKSAIGNYSGNVVFNTMINDVNISKTVSVSTEVLLEMSELMIYPLNTSFTTTANNSVEKSFSVCNKSLNKIEDIAWSSIGESGDGNIINWILNFSDLTNITELNSGECENIVLEFTIPQVSLKKFEASITASYNNSKKIDSEYTTFIFVNVIGTKNYFKQVFDNNLNANYFLSNFVKNTGSSFIPTGELDWNNLARNDTSESKVDNNIIYYGRELDETNFLFNDSNILGVWHLNGDLVDSSGKENNLVCTNCPDYVGGVFNSQCKNFDGVDDYLSANVLSNVNDYFTVSAWIYPTRLETQGETYGNTIFAASSGYGLWVLQNYNEIRVYAFSNCLTSGCYFQTTSSPIELNAWNHITVSAVKNGISKIYVNGKLIDSFNSGGTSLAGVFGIGDLRVNRNLTFKGKIEEAAIWNRVLSDDEVKSLYSSQSIDFREDVIGLWHLDGDIVDSSKSGFVGTNNGVNLGANGLWGTSAGEFNGSNSNIVIGDVLDMGVDDMTISAWIKTDFAAAGQYIVSKARAASQYYRYGVAILGATSTTPGVAYAMVAWDNGMHTDYPGVTKVNDGYWHNIVVVIDRNSNLLIYVDSKLDATYDISSKGLLNVGSNNPFRIGSYTAADNVTGSSFFNGKIEEVTIYKRALPSNEVRDIYNLQKGNWLDKDLVAYYKFNEVNGTTIFDSARGNDGVLTNGANINANGMWDSNALSLDGVDDYVDIDNIQLNSNVPFSINAWFYSEWDNSNNGIFVTAQENGYRTALIVTANNVLSLIVQDIVNGASYPYSTINNSFLNNKWNNVVANWNGTNAKIYINGIEYSTTKGGAVSTALPNIGFIGRNNWGGGSSNGYFNGLIDEVKIYSRALISTEILADYNSYLNSKFFDNNIIGAENEVTWQSLKINLDLNYSFGNELNSQFDENIVGLWHLNGDVNDASGNEFHGINNNITFSDGLWDTSAGVFNGSNSGVILNNFPQVFGTDMSVSMWAFFNDDSRGVLFGSHDVKPSISLEKHTDYRLRIYWNTAQIDSFSTNNVIEPNKWQFITYVRDKINNEFNVYVNGKLVHTFSGVGNDIVPPGPFYIGRDVRTGSTVLNGKIEEVILWDKALSAEEILDLFENSSKRIDLEVYSCFDSECSNKTSIQEIVSVKNNYSYDLSLNNSRYFGWNAYFRKASGLEDLLNNNFSKMPFIKDINIVSIIE